MDRGARINRRKDKTTMKNAEASPATDTAASVAEQGATVAPEKASSKKAASQKKDAPKGHKAAKSAKTKPAAKKRAKTGKNVAKPAGKEASTPRSGSKGAKILEMIGRAKGATLTEIMKIQIRCGSAARTLRIPVRRRWVSSFTSSIATFTSPISRRPDNASAHSQ
jgi:hypothetical protein